jgi:hypothetical protein
MDWFETKSVLPRIIENEHGDECSEDILLYRWYHGPAYTIGRLVMSDGVVCVQNWDMHSDIPVLHYSHWARLTPPGVVVEDKRLTMSIGDILKEKK